ncbi:class I SAM-dependent methyltransferase [Nocardioides terrisoli]|uniref:class I SAM-dependent methyltransferase n=1 Tax=Nocardioides terrisoli TaxID=3388267 RepID=UPI00287B8A74|nr:class I SAM-dependent methyltransferase [Nocardioides marmorisolisilvae]
MDEAEIRKSAALERRHWWYAARRTMVRRELAPLRIGRALDVGCGSGGNTEVLRDLGWQVTGLDHSPASAEVAHGRGLPVVRGDARALPFADASFDLVLSTDAWEHVDRDDIVAAETRRVLRPGGHLLLAVPAGTDLWSGHDVALAHFRRYERRSLVELVQGSGLQVEDVFGWNVLLRPIARVRRRRRRTSESEMQPVNALLNMVLRAVLAVEAHLPLRRRRGMSLVLHATRPTS